MLFKAVEPVLIMHVNNTLQGLHAGLFGPTGLFPPVIFLSVHMAIVKTVI